MELQLSRLPVLARLGLACLVLVLLFGLVTGAWHMFLHHRARDGRPEFGLDDVTGAYHGIRAKAPLLLAIERGHPEALPAADRQALAGWLQGSQLDQGYDDERLGERAPALVIERACLDCHSRQAEHGDGIGKRVPLEYLDDVKAVAISRDVQPTAQEIVVASAHTHALAMGTLTIVAVLLAFASRCWRRLLAPLAFGAGLGLLLDLGAWLPVRQYEALVYVLVGGGGLWFSCTALLLLLVLADLLRPGQAAPAAAGQRTGSR